MSQRRQTLSRRNFLLAAGAGGAAAAAAIVAKRSPPLQPAGDGRRASRGYHASEHINNYYRTTRI